MEQSDYIALEEAKNVIVAALSDFDPDLGNRARNIFSDEKRLNIVEQSNPVTNMMMCRPAGITMEDVNAAGMHIPEFSEKFGPHFTRQDNPNDFAIIDFEYHGRPDSIVWLAHELGHAIADGIQRENGRSFKDFSNNEMEQQAYFIQHIASKYVKEHFSDKPVQKADLGEDILKMSWDRASQFEMAKRSLEECLEAPPSERESKINHTLDCRMS